MIKYILFFLIGNCLMAQTVSTYFEDPNMDVDDAMVFDAEGNLYGSNFAGSTVYKISPAGVSSVFVGGFANPNGLAIDDDGNIFINEYSAQTIHKYNSTGTLIESYAIGGSPSGLIKAPNGRMIFTNVSNNSINELSEDGIITPLYTGSPLNAPVGLAYDENGILYVGNYVGREVYRYTGGSLEYVATVPDGGATTNPFLGFITYGNGHLWGTILGAHKIYKINPNEIDNVTSFGGGIQGSTDGDISFATFDTPNGIIYNESENALYVSEFSGLGNIRRIDDVPLSTSDFDQGLTLTLHPNPSSDLISVRTNGVAIQSYTIYDISGKTIETNNGYEVINLNVNISELNNGYYFMEVVSISNVRSVVPFIKR